MKRGESLGSPEFGKEDLDAMRNDIDALNAASQALSSDLRYIGNNDALTAEVLDNPELKQKLSDLRDIVIKAHEAASATFRSVSAHLAHSQSALAPLEMGGLGAASQKIAKKQHDLMLAERKTYFKKTADWLISTQFKNWIAPYAKEFIDLNKELTDYCMHDGKVFRELWSHTLITQCGTDICTMKTAVARLSSTSDPRRERETYREASGRAVQFFENVLSPFIGNMEYSDAASKKFALLNIEQLIRQAEELERGE